MSDRPTSVEPVKESLRVRGSLISGSMTAPDDCAVMTFSTPPGSPASSRICASASIDSGVCLAGLTTMVQPAAIAGPILRVPMARGKFHGVMNMHGPTGCFMVSTRPCALLVDRVAAVDAHRLLGEPVEEVRGVGDLRLGLGDRLAHLQRHQQREVVGALADQLVGAAQDVRRARAAACRATVWNASCAAASAALRVLDGRVGHLGQRLAGRRVLDAERPAARRVAPLAADVQLGGDGVEDCARSPCGGGQVVMLRVTVSAPSSSRSRRRWSSRSAAR